MHGTEQEMLKLKHPNTQKNSHMTKEQFYFTVYGWKKTGTEVVVEVLVLAHIIDLLPLCFCHLLLH